MQERSSVGLGSVALSTGISLEGRQHVFHRSKLSRDGAQAEALVLEKKVLATAGGGGGGVANACRYKVRVKFEDGSTTETSCHAFGVNLGRVAVGDVIPVRYDPADRSKVKLDRDAILEQQKADARKWQDEAIARGEQSLGVSSGATPSIAVADPRTPDTGDLRIGDADRDLIAEVLGQHMTDGRLTADELDNRIGALYTSQNRAEVRSVLAGLPSLTPSGGQPVPVLPDWVTAPQPVVSRPSSPMPAGGAGGATTHIPTDGEMKTGYRRWQANAEKVTAQKAAHKQAQARGDERETAVALMRLKASRAEEKSARTKLDELRLRRPDWTADGD
jgi:Domain of unknown function (DUF1707)